MKHKSAKQAIKEVFEDAQSEPKSNTIHLGESFLEGQFFHWKALGKDGMRLSEFNGDKYQDIDKSKLTQLILAGPDWRIWINTTTGEIYFDNKRIEHLKDYYNLPVNYSEGIIQYKNGNQVLQEKCVDLGDQSFKISKMYKNIIIAHYIGYKFHYNDKKIQVLVRVVPDDPTTSMYMDTKADIKLTITDLLTEEVTEKVYEVIK